MNPDPELLAGLAERERKYQADFIARHRPPHWQEWEQTRLAHSAAGRHSFVPAKRRRPTRHPIADKIVAGTLLFFWLVTMAAITYVPNLLGIVVLWVIWSGLFLACWRFYKDQTRPADGKPAVAQVHLPLLVRLFLLPGMVHVVGQPAVTKARHIRTIRRERASRAQAPVGYRIDMLEAELRQTERDTLA
jgi:hypothetical protein